MHESDDARAHDKPCDAGPYTGTGAPRRVSATGSENVPVTVVVTTRQGRIWISIIPPFTCEAIMEPERIDELMQVLRLAREEARRMTFADGRWEIRADSGVVREITSGKDHSRRPATNTT